MDGYGRRGSSPSRVSYYEEDEPAPPRRGRAPSSGGGTFQRLDSIQDPGKRYILKEKIASGICGDVYEGVDSQAGNQKVAIKVYRLTPESEQYVTEEYRVFKDLSGHPNLPEFYGIYRRRSGKSTENDQIWFVMEYCEGGSIMDLVRGLVASDRKMKEMHVSFVIREVVKALVHLHENNIIHRDVRGNNILLTKNGEVKLVDFGLSRLVQGEMGKRHTCMGSPCWMAPETVLCKGNPEAGYGSRIDVWAIGITAIELADGKPPFQDIHPTRALFQIIRNPPPNFYRPANWSQTFNDFVAECLEKNPDNRPFMAEIMEHPFLSELSDNDFSLQQDIKALAMDFKEKGKLDRRAEVMIRKGFLKTHQTQPAELMLTEDLAALEHLTEDAILDELHDRLKQGYFQTFVGDVLLILNPNEDQDIYGAHFHTKYQCKSRSDNSPHVYTIGDSAYQDVLHHEEAQHIILAGESNSGKSTNALRVMRHLAYLGKGLFDTGARLFKALEVVHAFSNAATPLNPNSTRCVLQVQMTFGGTGKASGGIFVLYQLEKWRVSTRDRNQSNFHAFYYLYDGLEASNELRTFLLSPGRRYRYLRCGDKSTGSKRSFKVRNDPHGNAAKFSALKATLKSLEMEEESEVIWKTLAAVLILGEVRFIEGNEGEAQIENNDVVGRAAELLGVDAKKFSWSLCNYCLIKQGSATRKNLTCDEAQLARDVLANTIYQRLVDWVVNHINYKLATTRTLYGDKFCINVLDLFGFECFAVNRFEQLFVNLMNEQLQCLYNQRIFVWEMQEQREEGIPVQELQFYDNREAVEQLMGKNHGLCQIIDDASRQLQNSRYITECLKTSTKGLHVKAISSHEFTVAHYTGKIVYEASEIPEKNRDFVPPEMTETMRLSKNRAIVDMFTNKLTRSGNLTMIVDNPKPVAKTTKGRWGAVLMQETTKQRKFNTASRGQFSQSRKMRTCIGVYRSTSLEILKNLSVGTGNGGTHFVRCIRADLESVPRGFHREVVRQQIRALAVLDTAKARQRGYPHRIPFPEFIRRYQFLAFDFDETVEVSKDNCRLLLIRLKMEGWMIGQTKVFLKYYNEEYLSRLYETQVKKIIKVQCMLRAFLARKNIATKITEKKTVAKQASLKREMTQDEAAVAIQKVYRGHSARKMSTLSRATEADATWDPLDQETRNFIKYYSNKWKSKSIFQVLLHYRAARYQDLVHFSQQVHLYNHSTVARLQTKNDSVPLERISSGVKAQLYLGERRAQVHKLPFNMDEELPFVDSSKKLTKPRGSLSTMTSEDEQEAWDAPLRRDALSWGSNVAPTTRDAQVQTTNSPHRSPSIPAPAGLSLIDVPFSRDPNVPVRCPPPEASRRTETGPTNHGGKSSASFDPSKNSTSGYNSSKNTGSIRSRKKVPPPPIPTNQKSPYYDYNYDSATRSKNTELDNDDWDKSTKNSRNNNRANPIQEMQMMARKGHNDFTEDDPPFNFQGMLRKTQHQRASMKRGPAYEVTGNRRSDSPMFAYKSEHSESNVVYRSDRTTRRDSAEWSPNEMVRMSEKFGREESWEREQPSKSITTELAPGIIVEGYVADL